MLRMRHDQRIVGSNGNRTFSKPRIRFRFGQACYLDLAFVSRVLARKSRTIRQKTVRHGIVSQAPARNLTRSPCPHLQTIETARTERIRVLLSEGKWAKPAVRTSGTCESFSCQGRAPLGNAQPPAQVGRDGTSFIRRVVRGSRPLNCKKHCCQHRWDLRFFVDWPEFASGAWVRSRTGRKGRQQGGLPATSRSWR